MPDVSITVLNFYTLKGTAEQFQKAIASLAARVRDEGHLGVLSYRFFLNKTDNSARAVVEYKNAAAWIGHHEIAMDWPEMVALRAVASLDEVTFLGPFTVEIKTWIETSVLTARIHHGNDFAAGFRRDTV